jgi:hypothetical protein
MAVTAYKYKETLALVDPKFGQKYMTGAENIQEVVKAIQDQWKKLADFDASNANS